METAGELLAQSQNWKMLQALQARQDTTPVALDVMASTLRQVGTDPSLAAALTQQLELRTLATKKFDLMAKHMLFTRRHLEQATRMRVAMLHANRFFEAGITKVADLGCGIGTESIALCSLGVDAVAIDLDPEAVACAAVNLREFDAAQVLLGDLNDFEPQSYGTEALFLDPARRDSIGRKLSPTRWSPPWSKVMEFYEGQLPLGVKLAPGIDRSLLPSSSFTQWLSIDGELVEAAMWSPELAPEGPGVSAAVLNDSLHVFSGVEVKPDVGGVLEFLFEPDSAVIRAGLVGLLITNLGGRLLNPRIAYGSADTATDTPFGTWFQVIDDVPLRTKTIKKRLQELDGGIVEVKKRGASIDPAVLQRDLRGDGSQPLVVFATRIMDKHRAIIAKRF
jgi:SAM-dependent methyltransferases related to tRNA (uracil-5-)-methyltransferase